MKEQKFYYNNEIYYINNNYGNKYYYKIGTKVLHRLDGPAVEGINGYEVWYQNGLLHRTDGPAIKFMNGQNEYWLHGFYLADVKSDKELIIKNLLE